MTLNEDRPAVLRDDLAEWADADVAAYALGRSIGLFAGLNFTTDTKHVFWTANPLGDGLHQALLALESAGVLESRGDPAQFRWRNHQRRVIAPSSLGELPRDEARRQLIARLARLRREAGDPSVRAIAAMIVAQHGKASFGSVHNALRRGDASWPMTAAIVTALGGDLAPFRELWTSSRSGPG